THRACHDSRTSAAHRVRLRPLLHAPTDPVRWRIKRPDHDPLERGIIFWLMRQFVSFGRASESLINDFTWRDACSSGHRSTRFKKGLLPLFSSLVAINPRPAR